MSDDDDGSKHGRNEPDRIAGAVCAPGLATPIPMIAAAAMALSSVSVVGHALRLRTARLQ